METNEELTPLRGRAFSVLDRIVMGDYAAAARLSQSLEMDSPEDPEALDLCCRAYFYVGDYTALETCVTNMAIRTHAMWRPSCIRASTLLKRLVDNKYFRTNEGWQAWIKGLDQCQELFRDAMKWATTRDERTAALQGMAYTSFLKLQSTDCEEIDVLVQRYEGSLHHDYAASDLCERVNRLRSAFESIFAAAQSPMVKKHWTVWWNIDDAQLWAESYCCELEQRISAEEQRRVQMNYQGGSNGGFYAPRSDN